MMQIFPLTLQSPCFPSYAVFRCCLISKPSLHFPHTWSHSVIIHWDLQGKRNNNNPTSCHLQDPTLNHSESFVVGKASYLTDMHISVKLGRFDSSSAFPDIDIPQSSIYSEISFQKYSSKLTNRWELNILKAIEFVFVVFSGFQSQGKQQYSCFIRM